MDTVTLRCVCACATREDELKELRAITQSLDEIKNVLSDERKETKDASFQVDELEAAVISSSEEEDNDKEGEVEEEQITTGAAAVKEENPSSEWWKQVMNLMHSVPQSGPSHTVTSPGSFTKDSPVTESVSTYATTPTSFKVKPVDLATQEEKSSKRPRYDWSKNREGLQLIKSMCAGFGYSRGKPAREKIFQAGLKRDLWTKDMLSTVHNKIDLICKERRSSIGESPELAGGKKSKE